MQTFLFNSHNVSLFISYTVIFFKTFFHPLLLDNQQQEISGFAHNIFNNMRVWLWCHLLFSVNSPPPTLNVSCYRAQRSSVVYFPMMLSAMWLTPLRGEGNQPFHLQRRGNVEVLTLYFPQLSSQCLSKASLRTEPFLLMWTISLIVL